jgi:hypothetical protein
MERRNLEKPACGREQDVRFAARVVGVALLMLCAAGCGAPGEPTPPSPPVAVAVSDLSAHQQGDGVQLLFTLPSRTIAGDRLPGTPALEILRGSPKPDGSPDPKSFRIVYTIPGTLVTNYVVEGQVKFTDPVAAAEIAARPGAVLLYTVRTRLSPKRASADSNLASTRMFPVPEPITSLTAQVKEKAIALNWAAPALPPGGESVPAASSYRVYRGELDPTSLDAAAKDLSQAKWKSPLALLASMEATHYDDTFFEFGKTYAYVVRSVVMVEGQPLESSDSDPAIVTPKDIFPPAAPQNVVGNVLPGATPDSVVVDLSWSISPETDLAGYRVYRSDDQGSKGASLTPDLLLAPAYRDTSVEQGHRYWYKVTAVDRAGNESESSAPVAIEVAQP